MLHNTVHQPNVRSGNCFLEQNTSPGDGGEIDRKQEVIEINLYIDNVKIMHDKERRISKERHYNCPQDCRCTQEHSSVESLGCSSKIILHSARNQL